MRRRGCCRGYCSSLSRSTAAAAAAAVEREAADAVATRQAQAQAAIVEARQARLVKALDKCTP